MRGQDNYTYRNTATYSAPTWALCGNVVSDNIDFEGEEISGKNRDSEFGSTDVGTKTLSGSLTLEYDDADKFIDADLTAFRQAEAANSVIDMLFLDGISTTGSGYRAPMKVLKVGWPREIDNKVQVTLDLKSTTWNDSGTLREPKAWMAGSDANLDGT